MRKTSEEFNNSQAIGNIGFLCGKEELTELPYWETIKDYLKRIDADALQGVAIELVLGEKIVVSILSVPRDEESLLSDPDRTHDSPDTGSGRKDMGEAKTKQGTET